MLVNDYVLMELNHQRRAQVAENIAALRAADKDRHLPRISVFRRRTRTAPTTQPAAAAIAFGAGSAAH